MWLPEEIKAQGSRGINRYLAELARSEKEEKIKRVRAIFIGNGEAGKTSLFMVEHYEDIQDNRAWQHGGSLESQPWSNTRALVRADYQSRVLSLAVAGDHVDGYFPVLYDSLLKILERMPRLAYSKRLHLNEAGRGAGLPRRGTDGGFRGPAGQEGRRAGGIHLPVRQIRPAKTLTSHAGGDTGIPPEPKIERKAMAFWRERLGDFGGLTKPS